jgi:hypothetical protein
MKKLLIILSLALLTAGSGFAQWNNNGYNQTAQTLQTITGTLQIINGVLAIVNAANQVYYVPNLQPYVGANGMFINTTVTVYGNVANNFCAPSRFMASGTWYNFPAPVYYAPPVVPVYAPMYFPPPMPRTFYGCR